MSHTPLDNSTPAPRYGPRTPTGSTRPPTGKIRDLPKRQIVPCTSGLKWFNKQNQTSEHTRKYILLPATQLPTVVPHENTYIWRSVTLFGPQSTGKRDPFIQTDSDVFFDAKSKTECMSPGTDIYGSFKPPKLPVTYGRAPPNDFF